MVVRLEVILENVMIHQRFHRPLKKYEVGLLRVGYRVQVAASISDALFCQRRGTMKEEASSA